MSILSEVLLVLLFFLLELPDIVSHCDLIILQTFSIIPDLPLIVIMALASILLDPLFDEFCLILCILPSILVS